MQRQLIVLEITVIFYTIIGGLLFSKLENWTFNDSGINNNNNIIYIIPIIN